MSSTQGRKPRERHDTKALVRLGGGELVEQPTTSDLPPRYSGMQLRDPAASQNEVSVEIEVPPQERAQRASEPVQKVDARVELELWFAGRDDTVRARGELIGDNLQLKAALPLFELGSETRYTLAGSAQEPGRARVRRVEVLPGVSQSIPELCVELRVIQPPRDSLEPTVRTEPLDETLADELLEGEADEQAAHSRAGDGGSRMGMFGAGIVGLLCGAGAMFGWQQRVELARLAPPKSSVAAKVAPQPAPTPQPVQLFDAVPASARASAEPEPQPEPPSLFAYTELPVSVALPPATEPEAPQVEAAPAPEAAPAKPAPRAAARRLRQ